MARARHQPVNFDPIDLLRKVLEALWRLRKSVEHITLSWGGSGCIGEGFYLGVSASTWSNPSCIEGVAGRFALARA